MSVVASAIASASASAIASQGLHPASFQGVQTIQSIPDQPPMLHGCSGMHRQLGALREMVAALDPELHALLAARDATNYFFCYRWFADRLFVVPWLGPAKRQGVLSCNGESDALPSLLLARLLIYMKREFAFDEVRIPLHPARPGVCHIATCCTVCQAWADIHQNGPKIQRLTVTPAPMRRCCGCGRRCGRRRRATSTCGWCSRCCSTTASPSWRPPPTTMACSSSASRCPACPEPSMHRSAARYMPRACHSLVMCFSTRQC